MSISGIIGMILILGFVVGGFIFLVNKAIKKESEK